MDFFYQNLQKYGLIVLVIIITLALLAGVLQSYQTDRAVQDETTSSSQTIVEGTIQNESAAPATAASSTENSQFNF